jgi:hypothetical protein
VTATDSQAQVAKQKGDAEDDRDSFCCGGHLHEPNQTAKRCIGLNGRHRSTTS